MGEHAQAWQDNVFQTKSWYASEGTITATQEIEAGVWVQGQPEPSSETPPQNKL